MRCDLTFALLFLGFLLEGSLFEFKESKGVSSVETYGYKALAGEIFKMQCGSPYQLYLFNESKRLEESIIWFRTEANTKRILPGGDNAIVKQGNYLQFIAIEERHAGNYCCHYGHRKLVDNAEETCFLLDVIPRNGTDCKDHGTSEVTLTVGQGGRIPCPGVSCYRASQKPITWYKGNKFISKLRRSLKIEENELLLATVYSTDNSVFTCDVSYTNAIEWTVRRLIKVKVIAQDRPLLPRILHPVENATEEAHIGKAKTLTCKVQFAFERQASSTIRWFMSYDDEHYDALQTELRVEKKSLYEETVIGSAHLPQVTQAHLKASFTCFAQNSIGNVSRRMRLRKESRVTEIIVSAPVVTLVFLTGVSVLIRVYWMEISIIWRTYVPFSNATAAEKEYDAFVSYASSSSSEDEGDVVMGDMLAVYHMPRVLEQQWGYKLCLLERDLVPGGAYTEEVLKCIQKSRMLICLLSPAYLRGPCLFELETGLKSLQEDMCLRVLLIWNHMPPRRLCSLPLPAIVRRALCILPTVRCTAADLTCSDSKFWKQLRLKMPKTKVCVCTPREDDLSSHIFQSADL